MANVDNPHGFRPLMRALNGGSPSVMPMTKDVDGSTAIFKHDIVRQDTDGYINPGGTPGTTRYAGVSLNYGAGSAITEHDVMWQPDAMYEAQDNNATDGITIADMGAGANAEFNAGSTTTKISGHEINETGISSTAAALDLKLISLYKASGNAFGANARIVVVINKHGFNKETDTN